MPDFGNQNLYIYIYIHSIFQRRRGFIPVVCLSYLRSDDLNHMWNWRHIENVLYWNKQWWLECNRELHNTVCLHLLYSLLQMKVCWFMKLIVCITSVLCGWSRTERKRWKSKTGIYMERCLRHDFYQNFYLEQDHFYITIFTIPTLKASANSKTQV